MIREGYKYIASLGDVNFIDYGGALVFLDEKDGDATLEIIEHATEEQINGRHAPAPADVEVTLVKLSDESSGDCPVSERIHGSYVDCTEAPYPFTDSKLLPDGYVDTCQKHARAAILEEAQEAGAFDTFTVYRVSLERFQIVEVTEEDDATTITRRYLVSFAWNETWRPHDFKNREITGGVPQLYREWFDDKLGAVAETLGCTRREIENHLCSEDPIKRGVGYQDMISYFGPIEFDQYPLTLARAEIEARYKDVE